MDCRTGQIHRFDSAQALSVEQNRRKQEGLNRLVGITEDAAAELEALPPGRRKNKMRNKPCPCGSGSKFKRCCWGQYA